jgi:hypothetical protein
MASPGDELSPWAILAFTLHHEVIHGGLYVLNVQSTAFPNQFLDVKLSKPSRARVVGYIQRICTSSSTLNKDEHMTHTSVYCVCRQGR